MLTYWGRVTQICVSNVTIIGSDIGLAPAMRQDIIWTNDGKLLTGALGTNFGEISIEIHAFETVVCEIAAILTRLQCFNDVLHISDYICYLKVEKL